jgi:D-arabinose 1-dehydrogenase-like Zn-dependent alcohol dehydrogenase
MNAQNRMNYIEITRPGGPEVLQLAQTAVPQPADQEVLIKVHAAGINRPDVIQRTGKYPMKPGMSPVPGLEVPGSRSVTRSARWPTAAAMPSIAPCLRPRRCRFRKVST